jgi:hypothetical protein
MRTLAAMALAFLVVASPAGAQDRISLHDVKRLHRVDLRGNCFDTCIKSRVRYCKRVGDLRAKCVGRVTWEDQSGVNTCKVIHRYKQSNDGIEVYRITKHCNPA